jgi:hypothetical protein
MRFTCWIDKATDTHSEYVTLIAFSRQQWLSECASMFPTLYVHCLSFKFVVKEEFPCIIVVIRVCEFNN